MKARRRCIINEKSRAGLTGRPGITHRTSRTDVSQDYVVLRRKHRCTTVAGSAKLRTLSEPFLGLLTPLMAPAAGKSFETHPE